MKKPLWSTLLLLLLVTACTAFIFSNSLKDPKSSAADSEGIVKIVRNVAEKIIPNNRLDWNYIVRKGAHLFEFFVLGLCTLSLALRIKAKGWKLLSGAFLYVLLIASSDEFIQRFTGRGAAMFDVVIDFVGATMGILSVLVAVYFVRRRGKSSN